MAFVEARAVEITSDKLFQTAKIQFLGGTAAQVLLLSTNSAEPITVAARS
jgi:hypothetical protein